MSDAAETLAQAKALYHSGRLADAARLYRQIVQADPAHAEAHYLLGVVCYALGRSGEAAASLQEALRLEPQWAEAHNDLGAVLAQQGKWDEAVASFQQAVQLKPLAADIGANLRNAQAIGANNRGNELAAQGRLDKAVEAYRRAIELKGDFAEAHNNLGAALTEQDQLDEAVSCFRRALALKSDYANAHANLGAVLARQRQLDEAAACCRRALDLQPRSADVENTLAGVLIDLNQLDDAAGCCRRALEIRPNFAEASANLAAILARLGKSDEAAAQYRRSLELNPDLARAHNQLGSLLAREGKLDEAAACCRQAVDLDANFVEAHNNLGLILTLRGLVDEAGECFERALRIRPDFAPAHSNALIALQYRPDVTLAQLAAAHREFELRHAAPLRSAWRPHDNPRDPERKLRLGFVSADFACHPVGFTLIRVLENIDPLQAEVICYHDRTSEDAMTRRLRTAAADWQDVRPLDDRQLAERVRADRIDVAFDMAGHTGDNRLLTFARKPAPIQVTWYGYVGTTGLAAMDYLLGDRHEVPDWAEPHIAEQILRMPDGYACYDPPEYARAVSPLPALANGYVTFGSFNNLAKITPKVIEAWARVLHQVPGSRLLLKYRGLDEPSVSGRIGSLFARHGVEGARLELLGGSSHADLLAEYQRVDLGLDPFPYNGGLTTCEALWMGVPVVTWPGETFAGRHSLSHLSAVGLTETIAGDLDEYLKIATELATDLPRLAVIRAGLREQMAASPLCDGRRYAENLLKLIRGAWRRWCANRAG